MGKTEGAAAPVNGAPARPVAPFRQQVDASIELTILGRRIGDMAVQHAAATAELSRAHSRLGMAEQELKRLADENAFLKAENATLKALVETKTSAAESVESASQERSSDVS